MKKLLFVLALLTSTPAWAQSSDTWDFVLTPYVWFAGVEGESSTIPGAPVVPIDISPSDALSDSQASFMMLFEAKKHHHGMIFEALYTDSESDTTLVESINLTMKTISRNKMFSAAYQYEFYNRDQTVVDAFAGARYWKVDTKLEFSGGLGVLAGQQIRNAESWVDPLIGVKGRTAFNNSEFFAVGWIAGGGFGVGSDSFYDVSANIGYQWNKAIGTTLGYRIFDVDYQDGSFIYDVKQAGWALGLSWSF